MATRTFTKISEQKNTSSLRKYPFSNIRIDSNKFLDNIEGRFPCRSCGKSRKFFCYTCYHPISELDGKIPKIELPVQVDIIKHRNEIDGKSTAAHAPILSPDFVKMFTYPDIPDYSKEDGVVLIFPGTKCDSVKSLFNERLHLEKLEIPKGWNVGTLQKIRLAELTDAEGDNAQEKQSFCYEKQKELPVRRAVFIDSTWDQCRGIYKDDRINSIRTVVLQNRSSQFWRHQRNSPCWYLATIESIHEFLLEIHINAWGLNANYQIVLNELEISDECYENAQIFDNDPKDLRPTAPYNGQYDNLLFFFAYMYELIHFYYDKNKLKSYKRPI